MRKVSGLQYSFWCTVHTAASVSMVSESIIYEGWNFNSGNYLFTTDTE